NFHFTPGLYADKPLTATQADGDVAQLALRFAAVAIAQPAELGQKDPAVALIELDLLGIGIAETVAAAFLLEAREVGPLGKEVGVGPLQVLERLLQWMNRRIGQPCGICVIAPLGEELAQARIA